jgi:acyl-coenzyme A synthetase/AMP-(fatty) acid ligase
MVEHSGLVNLAEAQISIFGMSQGDQVLQFASFSFDASIFEIVMALRAGATLHVPAQEKLLPGPDLLRFLKENAITNITIPPSVLAVLPEEELPDLKTIIVAGEACPADLVSRWGKGRRFFNAYGPTEATVWATVARCLDGGSKPTIGRPIPNAKTYLLDSQMRPVPVGLPGELHIGGAGLARGYLHRPELTAERFVPDPFSSEPGSRLYKTGDLARYLPGGEIDFLGRVDHQVKVRGFRIEPGEVESVLRQHKDVGEAIVIVKEGAGGEKRLVAYVTSRTGQSPDLKEMVGLLKERLPDFMIPSDIVVLDGLPRTPNGKLDRKALPEPSRLRPELGELFVPPQTELEQTIASVWQEVLALERVGAQDNFFDLGGHSLLMVQVQSKLQLLLNRDVAIIDLFANPTIKLLASFFTQQEDHQPATRKEIDLNEKLSAGKDRLKQMLRQRQAEVI